MQLVTYFANKIAKEFKITKLFFYYIQKFNSRFWMRNIIWS